MAEIENIEEIKENFDTIKTLLNSIRAQGILNTSDVDKLLTGINNKLEKINSVDDIELLKRNLTDLQNSLEERHSTLLSKFGAIESLFSNLLKNSSESLKSSEIKELFDIVATNLSVFSREIVSQKESLTDIAFRLESLRSDDSQKKEIIKSITSVKPDIERLNNGFDSIVINLNDGFKSIVNSISSLDISNVTEKLSGTMEDIEMSSKTVLSAIQVMDKKQEALIESLNNLYTKDDADLLNKKLAEIALQGRENVSVVSELNDRYGRIDILAEKIDASVNVIANLKAVLAEIGDKTTSTLLERIENLEKTANEITTDTKFADFKKSFDEIIMSTLELLGNLSKDNKEIKVLFEKLTQQMDSLSIDDLKQYIHSIQVSSSEDIKNSVEENIQKYYSSSETAITKVMDDIVSGTDELGTKLEKVSSDLSLLCENSVNTILQDITSIKTSLSQIDESNISANNAIYSNISDRLTNFEESLILSLKTQEESVKATADDVKINFDNLKKITGVLDYKLDASVVETSSLKEILETIRTTVDGMVALNFVEKIQDLRADIYATKQDIVNVVELDTKGIEEGVKEDLNNKYDALVNKLVEFEKSIKQSQVSSLAGINTLLGNISSSIVDVLSYLGEPKTSDTEEINKKIDVINGMIKESNISYIESVRDIVNSLKESILIRLTELDTDDETRSDDIKKAVATSAEVLKNEIKYSYLKILELQDFYKEMSEHAQADNVALNERFDKIITTSSILKDSYETQIESVKTAITEKLNEFKQEYTCDNADRINEIKLYAETVNSKNAQEINKEIEAIKSLFVEISDTAKLDRSGNFLKLQEALSNLTELIAQNSNLVREDFLTNANTIYKGLENVKEVLTKVDENVDSDMSRQLSLLESSFDTLTGRIKETLHDVDKDIKNSINEKLNEVSDSICSLLDDKSQKYNEETSSTLSLLKEDIENQINSIQDTILTGTDTIFNDTLKNGLSVYMTSLSDELNNIKTILNNEGEKSVEENQQIKTDIANLYEKIAELHNNFVNTIIEKFETIKNDTSNQKLFEEVSNQISEKIGTLNSAISSVNSSADNISTIVNQIYKIVQTDKDMLDMLTESITSVIDKKITNVLNNIENETKAVIDGLTEQLDILKQSSTDDINILTNRVELISNSFTNASDELKAYLKEQLNDIKLANSTDVLKSYIEQELLSLKEPLSDLLNVETFKDILNTNFEKTSAELLSLQDKLDDIENFLQTGSLSTDNTALELKLEDAQGDIRVLQNMLENFEKTFATTLATNSNNTCDVDDVSNDLKNIKASISNSHVFLQEIINQNNQLVNTLDIQDTTKLNNLHEEIKELLEQLRSDIANADALFKTIVENTSQLTTEVSDIVSDAGEKIYKYIGEEKELLSKTSQDVNNLSDFVSDTSARLYKQIDENKEITSLIDAHISDLHVAIDDLKAQFINKVTDKNEQVSVECQLNDIKSLIDEQLGYLQDINCMCSENILDIPDMEIKLENKINESIKGLSDKLANVNTSENDFEALFKNFKSEIITQFLNIFNQISFVAEQDEILDFIDEKHAELIDVLSHIVTSTEITESRIASIKEELGIINKKVSQILSSDEDEVDYIYSLQDLESDITNLRLVLNEMKNSSSSDELNELITSTSEIYKLVDAIKRDVPTKNDIESIAEDIVSISTRTNKLILASDESYKTLQDNLGEFKLVIDDLDERTRNFAHDSGMDKIDLKLNTLNDMMISGAKTNQVFNQVFEYLAEWVDKAGVQINAISDRVETLDDIGQIKVMLADLKEKAEDDSESIELIDALGNVFDKQNKKIAAIESKIDKMIVQSTIEGKKADKANKIDMTPMENTLNSFLVAIDERFAKQEEKVNELEKKLESIVSIIEDKDTEKFSKKLTGIDKQIAKLSKNIENIVSDAAK